MVARPRHAPRRQQSTSRTDPHMRKGRTGRPYRRWRSTVLEGDVLVCCRCGYLIDKRLRYPDPMSASADHLVPLTRGGAPLSLANGRPSHLVCNKRHSNGVTKVVLRVELPIADRRW